MIWLVWIRTTDCNRTFRSGYAFQSIETDWVSWCGGGSLDNPCEGV
jgi:hypothetical protein